MLKNRSNHQINCLNCRVNTLCLPKDSGFAEIQELNDMILHVENVEQGAHVFHAEDVMNNLYAVYSGSCKAYWLDKQGNERIDSFYLPGDLIGLESISYKKYVFSLVALEDLQLCVIPLDALFQFMHKNTNIFNRLINIASYKMVNDQHIHISTNANQRLADFILNMFYRIGERVQNTDSINLSMSQLDISNFLGIAHETVNRILRKFHKDKMIKIYQKKIYLLDVERLREITTPMKYIGQK